MWAGKAGTLALMFALPMFLLADAAPSVRTAFDVLRAARILSPSRRVPVSPWRAISLACFLAETNLLA